MANTVREPRQLPIPVELAEALGEAHFRSERADGHVGVEADDRAAGRVENVVAAIAARGGRKHREAHLRKQAIDVRPLFIADALVEQLRVAQRIAADQREVAPHAPRELGLQAAPAEVEAGADGLLEIAGDLRVDVAERGRIAQRREHAIFVEAETGVAGVRPILRTETPARKHRRDAVAAEQIAAAHFEEAAGREIHFLRRAAVGRRSGAASRFHARAVADHRRRRFVDGDNHVARALARLAHIGDAHAPEQTRARSTGADSRTARTGRAARPP